MFIKKKKILIIGSGAREHAIAKSLYSSKSLLYCFATNLNPGIFSLCIGYLIGNIKDIKYITDFGIFFNVDFAIVGPELPLSLGIANSFNKAGIKIIGPVKELARIESSKGFARDLLKKNNIPGLIKYKRFDKVNLETKKFLLELSEEYVIKSDGLEGGKGVKVANKDLFSHEEALKFCSNINGPFVIEEKINGLEFSLLSFSDGNTLQHMPIVQDYKRAYTNNLGPNTGGMGSYNDSNHKLYFLSSEDINLAKKINELTILALQKNCNCKYKGILYGGFIKSKNRIQLIEFNARFGDPEAINLLSILNTDFLDICYAIINTSLHKLNIKFLNIATVVKYIVPNGYPNNSVQNGIIDLSYINNDNSLFFGGVNQKNSKIITTSSRAIGVLGKNINIMQAEQEAEYMASKIFGPVFYRKDIGKFQHHIKTSII